MVNKRLARHMLAGTLLIGAPGAATPAQNGKLIALATVEPGQWQLKETGSTAAGRLLCVADPSILLQLRHNGVQCARMVITNTADVATVHYTCPGAGRGRTTITVETARLLHIQTQGIANGAPFDFDYEARRAGACTGG